MTLKDRLNSLVRGLPREASVTLSRADLEELLEGEEVNDEPRSQADYTVAQIAERFDRSPQTVREWVRDGRLTAYRLFGREYRITPAALAEFENRQRSGCNRERRDYVSEDLEAWRNVHR